MLRHATTSVAGSEETRGTKAMTIYGTALLAICLLVGQACGLLLGRMLGIDANVGGVGIAMLLLIVVTSKLKSADRLPEAVQGGILFWSSVYIPVVIAMAASLDVRGAVSRGSIAIVAGLAAAAAGFVMVPLLCRLGASGESGSLRTADIPETWKR